MVFLTVQSRLVSFCQLLLQDGPPKSKRILCRIRSKCALACFQHGLPRDYCLGWKGLCIEPTIQYHDQLRNERSCELVTNCLSDVEGEIISLAGEMSGVAGDRAGAINVTCRRLDNLLRERNIYKVDLWSLDVDGYETKIMGGMDWNDSAKDSILIQTILMEQQDLMSSPCTQINIDYSLCSKKFADLSKSR